VSFAFWSCQEYAHGYYNAHELIARGDYDFVVCLGDYIYAETYTSTAKGNGVRDDKIGSANPGNSLVVREATTYQDYLDKYSLYRSDPALRAVHAKFPMVMLWDDHEVQDNYAGEESDGGLPPEKRFSAKRKAAAYRAFFHSMPAYTTGRRQYRTLNFGKTVDLIIMDQRRYRADQPCDDAVVAPCADWNTPRDLLGKTQMAYVQKRLQSSKAAWKVLANEVTIMPTRVLGGANYMYDNWTGYPQEREQLLSFIRDKGIKDVVFITGDIHTFITGDVRTNNGDGDTVAVEFVGGSVTSQALGEIDLAAGGGVTLKGNDANPKTNPAIINALRGINPWVRNADFDHHGFARVRASQDSFDCDLVRLETIKKRSRAVLPTSPDFNISLKRGQKSIVS
jgi:alkaline phosphatase D